MGSYSRQKPNLRFSIIYFIYFTDERQYFDDRLPSPQLPGYSFETSSQPSPDPPYTYDPPYTPDPPYTSHNPYTPDLHTRSRSEALLETNFDFEDSPAPITEDSRSYSQPLETAM